MIKKSEISIYLADDHEIVANAISGLLLSVKAVTTVKTFSNGKDLYTACLNTLPDIIILDIGMPGWSGMFTLEKLMSLFTLPVIMLTMNNERAVVEACMKLGAKGYLHKNCSIQELEAGIKAVMSDQIFLSEEVKKIMTSEPIVGNSSGLTEPLTEKEYEVLVLVCEGLTSKEIGEKLFISSRTVETRKNNLMQKFNVQTTGKLISAALKNKIVN